MKALSLSVLIAAIAIQTAAAQIRDLVVTDAAAFTPGLPYYGSLASVFCTGLTGIGGIQTATQYPLPFQIAGVSVTVNGAAAPLLAVADLGSYQQINIQVPELQDGTSQILQVSQFGQTGQIQFQSPTAWGVFFSDSSGYAMAQHADYSLVTPDHPARPGEVLMVYTTNLDSFAYVSHAPNIGYPAEADPLPSLFPSQVGNGLRIAPFLMVNGIVAEIQYSGLTPGSVGVFQMNFRVPEAVPNGDAILTVVRGTCLPIGGCSSSTISYVYSRTAKLPVRAASPSQ
jgi:uncharacterized protein (TIGR03437 family)